ncbi:SDR family oxidoreductase [Nocardioides gansuensis]|uniref:SDR family oxidoreductase n=1 Tax=Nocardioides gansuensis TaxID=2138300 RepID=UPI0014023342|nr:SDR family oxidoreductase [Nocardioides gansuensis]
MSPDLSTEASTYATPSLALVTGAGSGIGRAVALALAARGHHVLALGRRAEPLRQLQQEAGGGVEPHPCDVTDPEAVPAVLALTRGRLDVVVAAAGTFARGTVVDQSAQVWEEQVRINLVGVHHTLQATIARMLSQNVVDATRGHVFTLNSGAGVRGFPGGSAYAAAKHGLRGLVESLREELAGQSVKLTDIVVSATVESEMSAGRQVPMIPADTVAHTVTACLDLGGLATWDRVDLAQLR